MSTIFTKDQLINKINDIYRNASYPLNVEAEPLKKIKTKSQLGYIFGGLIKVLTEYFNDIGSTFSDDQIKWDADLIKIKLYHNILGTQYKQLPDGQIIPYQKTLSKMSKTECSEFISKCLTWIDSLEPECILPIDLRFCWLLHITDEDIQRLKSFTFPERCPEYLSYLRKENCINCGCKAEQAHHIRTHTGLALKEPDWFAVSICQKCHSKVHDKGLQIIAPYNYSLETFCKLTFYKFWNHL